MAGASPFFHTPPTAVAESLAILHLKRDNLIPVKLRTTADDGYAEGAVTNTRFGSFPHSTLIRLEWGSQVRASKVDTGTRGRKSQKAKQQREADAVADRGSATTDPDGGVVDDGTVTEEASKKRKSGAAELYDYGDALKRPKPDAAPVPYAPAETIPSTKRKSNALSSDAPEATSKKAKQLPLDPASGEAHPTTAVKAPIEAGSGFIHLLQPTPESWTYSLDHRTQVVYTPDYSYILQRLRVKPGSTIIEAGAGSGSFTHAAARAVFSGYPSANPPADSPPSKKKRRLGQVHSYEFHGPRVDTLRAELSSHGLDGVVNLTHRDVCTDGFSLPNHPTTTTPNAEAIFLDLPAPWLALKHLTRSTPDSPLSPDTAVHLCTFSPCIEQVTATVSALRKAGWTEIDMVEVQNRRIDVRREQIGLHNEGLRGVNASAATVDEALGRLREVEMKLNDFHAAKHSVEGGSAPAQANGDPAQVKGKPAAGRKVQSKAERLARIKKEAEERKLYREGNLVHRTEPEVKTHTSYLVFAVLPREWREEDERGCGERWGVEEVMRVERVDGKGDGVKGT